MSIISILFIILEDEKAVVVRDESAEVAQRRELRMKSSLSSWKEIGTKNTDLRHI
jgi:hypothetical protein